MIDERINDFLQKLNLYVIRLREIQKRESEDFKNDSMVIAATERIFQLAIESCINISNRILSLEQFNKTVNAPETYADIFRGLYKINIIEEEFSNTLVHMAKFRNRLVHLYWEIEPDELY